jgi:exopolyphosphatase/guanosine-5'-triphosphate,3'-diphosphate pyrophosphatase
MSEKIAVIDIGTNSIKFCIAANNNGKLKQIEDSILPGRMGENFRQTGKISPSAMNRNIQILHQLCEQSRRSGVSRIIAIGTMILRSAVNANIFIQKVKDVCGIDIQVLSGDEEARLSYLAAISSMNNISGNVCVIDTGGGSTELTFGKNQHISNSLSFDIGAVILTESFCKHDPVTNQDLHLMWHHIQQTINLHEMKQSVNVLIGSCGAITTMAAVKHQISDYDPEVIHGSILTQKDVLTQINLYASKTIDQRKRIQGIPSGRADIALAGACISKYVMEKLQCDQIIVCDRGLRYGVILEAFSGKQMPKINAD